MDDTEDECMQRFPSRLPYDCLYRLSSSLEVEPNERSREAQPLATITTVAGNAAGPWQG
jgi:hypothetical protein